MHTVSVGPVTLSIYSLSSAIALAVGLVLVWRVARLRRLDSDLALDAALAGLLLGLIAGRLETVVTNLDYFRERPSLLLSLGQGGLGVRTLTVVGMSTYVLVVYQQSPRWRQYLSALTPALAASAAIMWAGALFWGGFAGVPWSGPVALALPDRYGVVVTRLPLQAVVAAAHAAFAVASATFLHRSLPPGLCLSFWGASTSALAAFLSNFRAEQPLLADVLPRPLVADLALAAAWLVFGLLVARRQTAATTPDETGPQPGGAPL